MLDQFTAAEKSVIQIAIAEFIINLNESNWQTAMQSTADERKKGEELLITAKGIFKKINL